MKNKFIVITGGVLSGLGKGVASASIGFFFSEQYKVTPVKLDGYLNSDPGTMNPIEHGEVFVLRDGFEVDMDFGHYERFLNINAKKNQSITMGKIFREIQDKERKGDYLGKTVQLIPHVTDLIKEKILSVSNESNSDITIIEVGGTIGDIENELFVEALRQLKESVGSENIAFIHMTYVPIPYGVKEQKTKPTQQSLSMLQKKGIWPSFILARCSDYLTDNSKRKISLFGSVKSENVYSAIDVDSIYKIPGVFHDQSIIQSIAKKLNLPLNPSKKLDVWNKLLNANKSKSIKVLIAGKYTDLEDSYASIIESLRHCEFNLSVNIEVDWVETTKDLDENKLRSSDAIIVPGGFGTRGIEGKIKVIEFARKNKIPYLGICYGLQLAVIEFARNKCGINDASSLEINPSSQNLVVTLLDEQKNVVDKGGTMRLGAYDATLNEGIIKDLYKKLGLFEEKNSEFIVSERHRHRFEVNPKYIKILEENGLFISGKSIDRDLVEFIELKKDDHPYFVATQAHPELKSKLEAPAPLFYGLIEAALKNK
ncbi:MAG: glutamine hydrolyzing CTP synthase [Candidatus Woesearchaeota archaeon]